MKRNYFLVIFASIIKEIQNYLFSIKPFFADLAKRNYHKGVTAINSNLFCFTTWIWV
jgi:hypothetical protein